MIRNLTTASAALALGSFIMACPATAGPRIDLKGPAFLLQIQDEENEEVWKDLRPDVDSPEAAVGEEEKMAPQDSMTEEPMGEGSDDMENEEVLKDLRTEEAPE